MAMQLMPLIGGFIGLVIILGVGTLILGNSTMDCSNLTGYDANPESNSTGWALTCVNNNSNAQAGYALLLVAVIVFAAVIILSIVRLLG